MVNKLASSILLLGFLFSCNNEDPIEGFLGVPKILTYEVSDIRTYSVLVGGEILDDYGFDITEHGILFGINPNPTIDENENRFIIDPTGSEVFLLEVFGLPQETDFYVRAYAINSEGIGYGNEVYLKTLVNKVHVGDVELNSQEEINEFGLHSYNSVDGDLLIHDHTQSINELSPLKDLSVIYYSLRVIGTQLEDFSGLENLVKTGFISNHGINIKNNHLLKNFNGLSNLEIARGNVMIQDNNRLQDFEGLNSLKAVSAGSLVISDCQNLESLKGLEKLEFIGDELYIGDNPILSDISSLHSLNYVDRTIYISNNNQLMNLYGLEGITYLEYLRIHGNNLLTNLDGLSALDSVKESISIINNNSLNDLGVFNKIEEVDYLTIEGNESLTDLVGFSNLKSVRISLDINSNPSLTSVNGIENLSSLRRIKIMLNNSLISLEGLSGLSSVLGDSSIGANAEFTISHNQILSSLSGLENLKEVDGRLIIHANSSMVDFCALQPLLVEGTFDDGDLVISNNLSNPSASDIVDNCE